MARIKTSRLHSLLENILSVVHFFVCGDMAELDTVFFLDEAWVYLDSYINTQNYNLWDSKNLHAYVKTGSHPQKRRL